MSAYQIDKGIPLPSKRGLGFNFSAALRTLEIGDSMLLEKKQRQNANATASKVGIKIVTRNETETHFRLWRTE